MLRTTFQVVSSITLLSIRLFVAVHSECSLTYKIWATILAAMNTTMIARSGTRQDQGQGTHSIVCLSPHSSTNQAQSINHQARTINQSMLANYLCSKLSVWKRCIKCWLSLGPTTVKSSTTFQLAAAAI